MQFMGFLCCRSSSGDKVVFSFVYPAAFLLLCAGLRHQNRFSRDYYWSRLFACLTAF